jgi:hypothetical protein
MQKQKEKMDNFAKLFNNRVKRGTLRENLVFTQLRTEAEVLGISPSLTSELYNYGKDKYLEYKNS